MRSALSGISSRYDVQMTDPSKRAPWLEQLETGGFPSGHERQFRYTAGQIPLPNETLRQTVSRPDLGGFYFIGESWAFAVTQLLAELDKSQFNVLDLGCGVGKTARFLALDSRIHYTGFDIFRPAIEWCNSAFDTSVGERFKFYHFDGVSEFYNPSGTISPQDYEFPVPDGSVDLAFAASLFTHLYEADMRAYLRQTARKLAPDGLALYSIEEATPEASLPITGTEQSIKMTLDFFVSLAKECGLSLYDPGRIICGQRAVVFKRSL